MRFFIHFVCYFLFLQSSIQGLAPISSFSTSLEASGQNEKLPLKVLDSFSFENHPCALCKSFEINKVDQAMQHSAEEHHFSCPFCRETSNSKNPETLKEHISLRHIFSCNHCSKTLPSRDLFFDHMKKKHHDSCSYCKWKAQSLQELDRVSKLLVINLKNLKEEIRVEAGSRIHAAECYMKSSTQACKGTTLKDSMYNALLEEIEYCDAAYSCPFCELDRESLSKSDKEKYLCNFCLKVFRGRKEREDDHESQLSGAYRFSLDYHIATEHRHRCDYCLDTFKIEKMLNDHISEKHPFGCEHCKKTYKSSTRLEVHKKKRHSSLLEKADKEEKDSVFQNPSKSDRQPEDPKVKHLYSFTCEERFVPSESCPECEKNKSPIFLTKDEVLDHDAAEHVKDYAWKCSNCDLKNFFDAFWLSLDSRDSKEKFLNQMLLDKEKPKTSVQLARNKASSSS